ncbi:MAG: TldD/PmbA family protein [Candidatus Bathyarchaeia archaeon]
MAALEEEHMLDLVENAVNFALKNGADEAEAFAYQGLTATVAIERGQISKSARIIDSGLGVRTIVDNAIGFSYTNKMESKNAIEETILKALSFAKASKPDKDWQGLPAEKPLKNVENTYDSRIAELRLENLVDTASLMLEAAEKTDKRAFPIEGGVGASHLLKAVANSNGVASFDHGTIIECSLATVGQEAGEATPICFEFNIERNHTINPEWVGVEAARLAVSSLKARKMETKNLSVVFSQYALQELFHYTLINAVKADYVQRNQSAFKDKIGEKVASEILTIYDDGLLSGGIRTWKFDGEGVPQQKTLIIEKGVLQNFLYDNYTAKKDMRESTGNAARAGYLSTPNVDATNFRLISGNKSPETLIGEVDDGLFVHSLQGAHSSNPSSGEFSVVASPAWRIKRGEIAYAVKGVMLAGDVFRVLHNISALANNERKIGQLVAPWVLVENIKAIGK